MAVQERVKMYKQVHAHGFVELIDVMGDDQAVVDAARVSIKNAKPTSTNERLIKYLMQNKHMSPFEMVEFKFRVKAPIFVAREWVRHRTANWNEVSSRYAEMDMEFYVPEVGRMNKQSKDNKQGSSEEVIENAEYWQAIMNTYYALIEPAYKALLASGLSKELARTILPVSIYTEWVWKIDLRNLLNFLDLRLADNAQKEIRDYAEAIKDIITPVVPLSMAAWVDTQV